MSDLKTDKMFQRAMAATKKPRSHGMRTPQEKARLWPGGDLDEALDAYLTAAIWSTGGTTPEGEELENLDDVYSVSDFSPEAIRMAKRDIKKFFKENRADLLATGADASQHGHDLWLTRERHGVGFWDRGYPEDVGDRLTKASHKLGEADVYVGDDNKLYFAR